MNQASQRKMNVMPRSIPGSYPLQPQGYAEPAYRERSMQPTVLDAPPAWAQNPMQPMASMVLASAYFATVWIGRSMKREVLAEHLTRLGKRLGEVPEFAAYAIADGIKRAFTRFGKWLRSTAATMVEKPDTDGILLLPGFAELLDTHDG